MPMLKARPPEAPPSGQPDTRLPGHSVASTDALARARIPVLRRDVVAKLVAEMRNRGDVQGLGELVMDVFDGLAKQHVHIAERGAWACMRDALGRLAAELALANEECARHLDGTIAREIASDREREVLQLTRERDEARRERDLLKKAFRHDR